MNPKGSPSGYDILFLGGGPAGYEGALYAAKKGLSVAVVEKNALGGTCLQWGCIPTKNLIHAVRMVKTIQEGPRTGIACGDVQIDLPRITKKKQAVVTKLTRGIEYLFDQQGIPAYRQRGTIRDQHTIRLENGEEIQGRHIVVATGSRPAALPHLDFNHPGVMDSTRALELSRIPQRMLVVGAGAVGLEIGLIYRYLGAEVTIVEIMDQILPGSDREVTALLQGELKKQKIRIHTGTALIQARWEQNQLAVEFKKDEEAFQGRFDVALLSVGRKPNSGGVLDPGLAIQTDDRGFIQVDSNLRTSLAGIFACGDVIGGAMLAHKASHQAKQVVDYILTGKPVQPVPIPAAVFTFPELAAVGITEEEARENGMSVQIGRFPYSAGSRSNAEGEKAGLVKVIAGTDGRLLGAHIVGAGAAELIQVVNFALARKMRISDFEELVTIHPTLGENVYEAIGEIGGFSIHI